MKMIITAPNKSFVFMLCFVYLLRCISVCLSDLNQINSLPVNGCRITEKLQKQTNKQL